MGWILHENNSLEKVLSWSMGFYPAGLIIERIFASEIWGAYLREGLFLGGDYYLKFMAYFKIPV